MDELRPCPFCGGKPVAIETHPGAGFIECTQCGCAMDEYEAGDPETLTKHWNRRAERTCHIDMPVIDWETGETDYVCSACGFSADPQDWAETYDYCPRCGARVVTADADR